jgi:aminoglycoside phosphotransferase (APT) family kinase protein
VSQAQQVRLEDAFDMAAAAAWLTDHAGIGGVPEVLQFPGGASNLTYLLRYPDRQLVLRRPPTGTKARGAHDMAREYEFQAALQTAFPYVPEMVARCEDPSVIGSEFYVMTYVPGVIVRGEGPQLDVLGRRDRRDVCVALFDRLVDLHRVDVSGIDPSMHALVRYGKGPGYVGRQVAGWSERYRRARTPGGPAYDDVMAWLGENQPADSDVCVIHNDWRFDNVVLDPTRLATVRGVLDWEMATIGDPLMDLGGALAYWVQADDDEGMQRLRRQPSDRPGMLSRAEIVEHYRERTGVHVEDWVFYEVFGLFRLAVILQQIWYRYEHGQTTNPAFREFGHAVGYLETRCRRLIAEGAS